MENDPKSIRNGSLKYRTSNFQPLKNKRPFENTDNYQNHMKTNRMDPRIFSVYKVLEENKIQSPQVFNYVEEGYVTAGYIETFYIV